MKQGFSSRVDAVVAAIRRATDFVPHAAIVTGTGLGPVLDDIRVVARLAYADLPGFPVSTAPSHAGELLLGMLGDLPVVAQNGRFHLYEGWEGDDIVLPVYVMRALGAKSYVVTNAAGALNPDLRVGSAVLIQDHISFLGVHPLAGPNDDRLGLRFPDMSRAYDPDLRAGAITAADAEGVALEQGIYAAVHGPEFETSAERRFLRMAGGDLVGMSTVLEVVAANHAGMRVLGFSAVTNNASGGPDQQPDTLEEVLENAAIGGDIIRRILLRMIREGGL